MKIPFRRWAVMAACVLGVALPAAAQKKYDPGASDTEIVLGMTVPLSGPLSGYSVLGKVPEAYFKMLNDKGGINGRKVKVLVADDQYSPPKTVEATRRLVEQEQVLALFGGAGTAPNLAVQRYLNTKKVPQLFIQSGAAQFNDAKRYPWSMPLLGSYQAEGRVFARHLLSTRPNAKIAVLMQNDEAGRELLRGLQAGLAGQDKAKVVAQSTFEISDPTVDSQIVQLKASGADTLMIFGTVRSAAQAIRKTYEVNWRPERYINVAAASVNMTLIPAGAERSKGVMTLAIYKDPGSPRWAKDAEMIEYKAMLKTYAPDVDPDNGGGVSGYLAAQLMAHVLRTAGDNLTRENLRQIASNLKDVRVPMMLSGVVASNSPADLFAYATLQPVRFNGTELEPIGPVLSMK